VIPKKREPEAEGQVSTINKFLSRVEIRPEFFNKKKPPRKEPMMKKILRIGKGVKIRRARVKEICEVPLDV
jgi:hypothetical protein